MNQDPVAVSDVRWQSVFPSLRLLDVPRIAFSPRLLLNGLLAVVLTNFAASFLVGMFPKTDLANDGSSLTALRNEAEPSRGEMTQSSWAASGTGIPRSVCWACLDSLQLILQPTQQPFDLWLRILFGIIIVSLSGTAIARITAFRVCQNSGCGIVDSIRFAAGKWKSLLVMVVVAAGLLASARFILALAAGSVSITGLINHAPYLTAFVILPVALCCGLTFVVVTVAWLLGIAAIGVDRCDAGDALSRGINYVLTRRLLSLLHAAMVLLLCGLLKFLLTAIGHASAEFLRLTGTAFDVGTGEMATEWAIRVFVEAALFSTFFSSVTVAYLLLRKREDGVRLEEML